VNNIRYVEWIQDISKDHWFSSFQNNLDRQYIWVVASHFIEYKRPALLDDELLIETFVERFEHSFSFRRVEISNKKTRKILVTALTKWCLIDPTTQRAMKIPNEILDLI